MNDNKRLNALQRWRRRLTARFASPQTLFLAAEGVQSQAQALPGTSAGAFVDWCAVHPGEAVELIVSTRLLHEMVCEPGLPLDEDEALQSYARQLFSHYFGAAAQRWPLAAWRAADRRGATALHGLDWAAFEQAAGDADIDLRRVRPAWAPLLQRLFREEPAAQASTAALAWAEGNLLTWVLLKQGQLQSLRQMRLAEPTQAALAETLAELRAADPVDVLMAAGYGLAGAAITPVWPGVRVLSPLDAAGPDLALFDGADERGGRLPQPDFLGQRIRRSLLAWPLALTGALVLATAAWSALGSRQQAGEAQAQVADLQARSSAVASGRKIATVTRPASSRPNDVERLRAAAEVQALLQQNWEPLLANLEEAGASLPAGQLSWLALDYSAGRNELRLEGLVQDKGVALQLVDRLAAAPGWGGVVVSRFQNGEQGLTGQRFELSARLQSDRLKLTLPAAPKGKTP